MHGAAPHERFRRKQQSTPSVRSYDFPVSSYELTTASIVVTVTGEKLLPTSIYAPEEPHLRAAFFKRIRHLITGTSIIGTDANCVPDVSIDVQCAAGTRYPSNGALTQGAAELQAIVVDNDLTDITRQTLGTPPGMTSVCTHGGGGPRSPPGGDGGSIGRPGEPAPDMNHLQPRGGGPARRKATVVWRRGV